MKRLILMVCVIGVACPLSFAGNKKKQVESKVLPEVRPDKALVYVCQTPPAIMVRGKAPVFLDDTLLGGGTGRKACTYGYVEPGTHVIWNLFSKPVHHLAVGYLERYFEAGQTYYFSFSDTQTFQSIANFREIDAHTFKSVLAGKTTLASQPVPWHDKELQMSLKGTKRRPKMWPPVGVNNYDIAGRRLDQANDKVKSAETGEHHMAFQDYEKAISFYAEAANKFDELKRLAKKNKKLAVVGNILGPALASAEAQARAKTSLDPSLSEALQGVGHGIAFYRIYNVSSFKELLAAYEDLEAEARAGEAEVRRRLACYAASKDDAVIDRCIGSPSEVSR